MTTKNSKRGCGWVSGGGWGLGEAYADAVDAAVGAGEDFEA
jgi:hypothetical protein